VRTIVSCFLRGLPRWILDLTRTTTPRVKLRDLTTSIVSRYACVHSADGSGNPIQILRPNGPLALFIGIPNTPLSSCKPIPWRCLSFDNPLRIASFPVVRAVVLLLALLRCCLPANCVSHRPIKDRFCANKKQSNFAVWLTC